MHKYSINHVLFLLLFATACESDQNLVDFRPVTEVTTPEGYEFFIRGSIGGEPFELGHLSRDENNRPSNDGQSSSAHPFFGTNFVQRDERIDLVFGITELGSDLFTDIVREGSLSWYGYEVPSDSRREAFIANFFWKGNFYLGPLGQAASQETNVFNITGIELLPLGGKISEDFEGRLYRVSGNFRTVLDNADTREEEEIEMIIDEFSAIFYDDVP